RRSRRQAETGAAARRRRSMPRPTSRQSRCVPSQPSSPQLGYSPFEPPPVLGVAFELPPPLAGEGWGGGNLLCQASHNSAVRRKPIELSADAGYANWHDRRYRTVRVRRRAQRWVPAFAGTTVRVNDGPVRNRAAGQTL